MIYNLFDKQRNFDVKVALTSLLKTPKQSNISILSFKIIDCLFGFTCSEAF